MAIPGLLRAAHPGSKLPSTLVIPRRRGGAPPPAAPRLELAGSDGPLALDALGIAQGGIRTPWVDAPTGVLSGFGQSGAEFAFLFGTTRLFDAATLARLYPGGRAEHLARFEEALTEALARGFLLEADAAEIRAVAAAKPW